MAVIEEGLAPPTRFDWNFRIGDIPVRVHPFFWLVAVLIGLDLERPGFDKFTYLLVWVAVEFFSILVHELGHVLMGRYFGSRGHILLTGVCGLAIGSAELPHRWQRNAVSFAGPGADFLLAALVAGVSWFFYPEYTLSLLGSLVRLELEYSTQPPLILGYAIWCLLWLNIVWGLVNLAPIWPLDGGQITREICQKYQGRDGMQTSLVISIATAGGLAVLGLVEFLTKRTLLFGPSLLPVVFFAILGVGSWQLLQHVRRAGPDWDQPDQDYREPWEQDPDWWKHGGGETWRD
jgi:Zn-dependent protease